MLRLTKIVKIIGVLICMAIPCRSHSESDAVCRTNGIGAISASDIACKYVFNEDGIPYGASEGPVKRWVAVRVKVFFYLMIGALILVLVWIWMR